MGYQSGLDGGGLHACRGQHCEAQPCCAVQEEAARRERLLRARASLAEEQRGNAARLARQQTAGERLAAMQVDSSCCATPSAPLLLPALPDSSNGQPAGVQACCLPVCTEGKKLLSLMSWLYRRLHDAGLMAREAVLQAQRAELEKERERLQAALAQRQTAAAVQPAPEASVEALLEAVRADHSHHSLTVCPHSPLWWP